jgi:hypothetical protein
MIMSIRSGRWGWALAVGSWVSIWGHNYVDAMNTYQRDGVFTVQENSASLHYALLQTIEHVPSALVFGGVAYLVIAGCARWRRA